MIILLFSVIAIGSAIMGVWRFMRQGGAVGSRIASGLLPLSAGALAALLITRVIIGPAAEWNEGKLAPVVAMTRGYSLYQSPETGVTTAWIYGPIGALVMLPASIAKSPTTAIFIGVIIALIVYLAPAAWLLARASEPDTRPLAIVAFLAFVWITLISEDLGYCALIAGVDAPALGLGACACAAIYRRRTTMTLLASAVLAMLCVWTKQSYLPLLVGLVGYVVIADGLRKGLIFAALLAASGAVISGTLIALFGARGMYFHMVTLPASHPWQNGQTPKALFLLSSIGDLICFCAPGLAILTAAAVIEGLKGSVAQGAREWLRSHPWSLLGFVAMCMPIASLAGYVKVGGYVNSLGATNYFLTLTALAAMVHSCSGGPEPTTAIARPIAHTLLLMLGVVFGPTALLQSTNGIAHNWNRLMYPYQTPQEDLFRYVKAHPDENYCPWNPLTTLLADGKLYHFEWGVLDRVHASRPLRQDQFVAHAPSNLRRIIYTKKPQSAVAHTAAFPNIRNQVSVPELPGCLVYAP